MASATGNLEGDQSVGASELRRNIEQNEIIRPFPAPFYQNPIFLEDNSMTKYEIERERHQNSRRRRRAQVLELLAGAAIFLWIIGNFGFGG